MADDKQKPSRGSGKKGASAPQPGAAAAAPDAAQPFPIVGIGASAGGLKALEAFFAAMPRNDDVTMAFVVVQHLAPDHKSLLVELVRRYTRMQVVEAENSMTVEPNRVYIIPPARDLTIKDGKLWLAAQQARGPHLTIDHFFRSLADEQHERAICIVMSGTGSDGTLGLRAVKGEGGMAIVQAPDTAEYDGMPRSAIDTGLVDFVLSPARHAGAAAGLRAPRVRRTTGPGRRRSCATASSSGCASCCARRPATTSRSTRKRRWCGAWNGAWRCTRSTCPRTTCATRATTRRNSRRCSATC